jgi:hypothetical protein
VPEQRHDPLLDARQLGDRAMRGLARLLACEPGDQHTAERRPRADGGKDALVEDRGDHGLGHAEPHGGREHPLLRGADVDDVARAEQLACGPGADQDVADRQPRCQHHGEGARGLRDPVRVPQPGLETQHRDRQRPARVRSLLRGDRLGEVGVEI